MNRNLELICRLARAVAPLLLLLSLGNPALLAQTLQITSPADGTIVAPGQVVSVTVAASVAFQQVVVIGKDPIGMSAILAAPPYQFSMQIPSNTTPGRYSLTADGVIVPGQGASSDPISVDVERADNPVSLSAQEGVMSFHLAGDQCPLLVVGTFSDGSLVDVTDSSYIAYQSDTPGVATVDSDGHVTAVAPGSANITATYAGVSTTVAVTVQPPVKLVPSPVSLYVSQTKQFVAQLNMPPDVDPTVTWSISPQLGSIDQTGLYSAPSSVASWQGVTVTATSVADPTKSASAQVWVFPPVSVSVIPSSATMSAAQARSLVARVGSGSMDVTWTATPSGVGTLQLSQGTDPNNPYVPIAAATYFAPAPISTAQTVTLTATSVYDNSKAASAQISLVPSVAMSVSPATVSLYAFRTQQFAATVSYSPGGAVSWSLDPNVGTIDATGLYTAPASVISQQTVNVTATGPNIGAGTYSATATVTLLPRISASITVPTGLTATGVSNSQINLSWTSSTEPGGTIAGYDVYQNGVRVASTVGTSYADLGLIAGTSYAYTVAAYDASGMGSAQSAPISASTLSGIPPNLVAYYNFNEGAGTVLHDSSGNGSNGTIAGATWSASGKYGGTLVFNGGTGYVIAPNANVGAAMTLEAWVNPATIEEGVVATENFTGASPGWFGLFDLGYSGPQGDVVTGSSCCTNAVGRDGNIPLTSNVWTHLALTYDGTAVQLFIDGVQVGSQPQSGVIDTGSQPLHIGGDPHSTWGFTGMIDELRIYNRALSQTEIQNDMPGNGNIGVTVAAAPATAQVQVDGVTYTGSQAFQWVVGSTHTLTAPSPQAVTYNSQTIWTGWSNGAVAASQTIVVPSTAVTYTATYTTLSVFADGPGYNRGTRLFYETETITNTRSSTVNGPVEVVFNGLPSGMTLANAAGTAPNGSPYLTIASSLAAGGSASVMATFSNPSNVLIPISLTIYSGAF